MADYQHHLLDCNGSRIHAVELGTGPLVILVHGFPESWYSWKFQLQALADAGYRAVAIDQRGYGQSSKYWQPEAYRIHKLVDDVIGIDAALHDYLEAHGENTDTPLVALCPMSVRDAGDDTASTQATALHVRLGEPGATPQERLLQVIECSTATKQEARGLSREALVDFALVMVGVLELADHSPAGRFLSPSYNVLVSNVPGPAEDVMYLRGARQLASYPISAFLPGSNLNVTVLSHGDKLDFGMVADEQALPDLQFVARNMEKCFAQLEAEVLGKKRKAASKRG